MCDVPVDHGLHADITSLPQAARILRVAPPSRAQAECAVPSMGIAEPVRSTAATTMPPAAPPSRVPREFAVPNGDGVALEMRGVSFAFWGFLHTCTDYGLGK